MKRSLLFAVIALALVPSAAAFARDTYVRGHVRSDGTYVEPHHRTSPDSRRDNNYSSEGMVNPYTGKEGTVNPYAPLPSPYPSYPTYEAYPHHRR